MKKSREIAEFYDNFSERQMRAGVNERHKSILNILIKSGLNKSDKILEIGCGVGTLTGLLAEYVINGEIMAVDISEKSIEIAGQRLAKYQNLKLLTKNVIEENLEEENYDVIVLPDVIEHIPIEQHPVLFKKLNILLKPQGFVLIHIPNPEHLEWYQNHNPELLQIVDQPIHTNILAENAYSNGFYIFELKNYSIWLKDPDYQYAVLKKRNQNSFTENMPDKRNIIKAAIHKVKQLLNTK